MPNRSPAYRTSTDHAAPYVTLKVKIVSARVRIGGCPTSQRNPSSISERTPGRSGRIALTSVMTREMSNAPSAKPAAFAANGMAGPTANRNAPTGGRSSWFVRTNVPCIRALAMPRSSRAKHLRRAEDEQGEQHEGDIHGPANDRCDECHEHERATKIHHDDHSLPVESVGGHAADDAEHEHRQVLAQQGHRHEERVPRHRGDEQRPGGDRDAVAGVIDERCREQPAEAPTEPRRHDGLGDPGEKKAHRRQDSKRGVAIPTRKTPAGRLGAAVSRS